MNAKQVHVLLDLDQSWSEDEKVDMPASLGRWVKVPAYKGPIRGIKRPPKWRFSPTREGNAFAAEVRRLSDAANESMQEYLAGEHANCFPGAFRDGFARGVAWARQQNEGGTGKREPTALPALPIAEDDAEISARIMATSKRESAPSTERRADDHSTWPQIEGVMNMSGGWVYNPGCPQCDQGWVPTGLCSCIRYVNREPSTGHVLGGRCLRGCGATDPDERCVDGGDNGNR